MVTFCGGRKGEFWPFPFSGYVKVCVCFVSCDVELGRFLFFEEMNGNCLVDGMILEVVSNCIQHYIS